MQSDENENRRDCADDGEELRFYGGASEAHKGLENYGDDDWLHSVEEG